MTKIIDLLEVMEIGGNGSEIFFSKESFEEGQLLIAQANTLEQWHDVEKIYNPPYLKTGYTMYILTKHQK